MLQTIIPKLPMSNRARTEEFYVKVLGFHPLSDAIYNDYLMLVKDQIEIHFFLFEQIIAEDNYGQVYIRTHNIDKVYADFLHHKVTIHPQGALSTKLWGQREFSILDPDSNLLTFGESIQ